MKVRTIHTAVIFLLSFVLSAHCVFALDDVLIDQPLTWSIDSVNISWDIVQNNAPSKALLYIYLSDEVSDSNPLSLFGLHGTDVRSSVYEGGFSYNQIVPQANPDQWSEAEKENVNNAFLGAFESDGQTTSNQRLVFTVKFVNHTKSHIKFDYRYTNNIPVYIGQTELGKAALVGADKAIIYIPPTGEPVSVVFETPIDESCKSALLENKPLLKFSEGKLFFRTPDDDVQFERSIYKKSVTNKEHFTVAILADREVIEWRINWIDRNPVTLQEALEAINDKIRREKMDDDITVFDIKDKRLVSVCGSPFTDKDDPEWITELKVFKDGAFQTVADPDSYLSQAPHSGERYVFQIADLELKKLIEKANAGDAAALNELGERYYFGDGVHEDKAEAIKLWQKSADQGNLEALNSLAFNYSDENDSVKAFELWRKAAELGHSTAQYNLGVCYFTGSGVTEDKLEALKWYRKAAEQGYSDAQYNLGEFYLNGEFVPEDKSEAVKWFRKAAQQSHAEAQYNLGICYYNGIGVPEDKAEAAEWFHLAAEQGCVEAQYYLGYCYLKGDGVEKDMEEAVLWFHMAAQQGYATAYNALGACYENGYGVEKDMQVAVSWYRKAAKKGDEVACNNLGICYEDGKGVEKDMKEAVSWYQKAAEKDSPEAQFNLGDCYYNGEGVAEDKAEAVKWFRKSAESGIKEAQFYLGNCYKSGEGVEKDVKEAAQWYQKAADQGYEDAIKALKELKESDK